MDKKSAKQKIEKTAKIKDNEINENGQRIRKTKN